MHADDIRILFDYSYAATGRVLEAASRLSDEAYASDPPLRGSPSLQRTLVHMLDAEQGNRAEIRPEGDERERNLEPAAYPDVPSLTHAWQEDEQIMRSWLATLDDAALIRPAGNGQPLWLCLMHIVNHSTQHRSEAAAILTHWGESPDDLDISFWLKGWSDD